MNILVIGSINIDEVNYLKNFPLKGETIISDNYNIFHGAKGANQAIAIKRMPEDKSINILMFAKVGNDDQGEKEIKNLIKNNIDTTYVQKSKKKTGKATILISYLDKDNKIIVNKGANGDFSNNDGEVLTKAIKKSDIILLQLEINDWLVQNALRIANKNKKIVVLNPAPSSNFKTEWLQYIDWIIPNQTELEFICNKKIKNIDEMDALSSLRKNGLKNAIVTLGNAGVYISRATIKQWFEAEKVQVKDTTAAGDTFTGAFIAFYLSQKIPILNKI